MNNTSKNYNVRDKNSNKNKIQHLYESLKMDRDEIHSKISCLRNGIKILTNEEFLKNFVDMYEMPESLDDLINGYEKNKLDKNFLLYKQGKYDGYKLMCDTEKIFHELFRELNELIEMFVYGKTTEKEYTYYERT